MSADDVAKAFIPHYYNLFDTNREGLAALFRNGAGAERAAGSRWGEDHGPRGAALLDR